MHFFLDQIEDVVEYIRSQGCSEIAIQALGYEVDDVSKLRELNKGKVKEIKIAGKGERSLSVEINLNSSNVDIYVYSRDWSNEHKNGVIGGIESILKRGDRKYLSGFLRFPTPSGRGRE